MGEVVTLGNLLAAIGTGRSETAPWLEAFRDQGRSDFIARGLPTRRVEAWKYSDLARALGETAREDSAIRPSPTLSGATIAAFENGVLDEANSDLAQRGAISLRAIMADPASPFAAEIGQVNPPGDHAILSLNAALMEDGLVLRVPKGEKLSTMLHLRLNWQGRDARVAEGRHIRVVIVLDEGAEATIVESHTGSPGFATIVTELRLAASARLNHLRLERLGSAARQSAVTLGELGTAARYQGFYLSEGGHFVRHEVLLRLAGEDAEAQIDGAYLVSESRHTDNTTILTHAAPNTVSRQAFRGVLGGRAKGVYQGCVKVEPGAQGTDARQMSRALLLSRHAEVATKPELEIFADDVKCSHGATAGELDAAALFFLRARGIPETEARALLVEAFLGQAIEAITSEALRDLAAAAVQEWLSVHAGEVAHVE